MSDPLKKQFNFTKKRTIIGIVGAILSISLVVLFLHLSPGGAIGEIPFPQVLYPIFAILFILCAMASLMLIFVGKYALVLMLPITLLTFLAVIFQIADAKSHKLGNLVATIILDLLLCALFYLYFRNDKKQIRKTFGRPTYLCDDRKTGKQARLNKLNTALLLNDLVFIAAIDLMLLCRDITFIYAASVTIVTVNIFVPFILYAIFGDCLSCKNSSRKRKKRDYIKPTPKKPVNVHIMPTAVTKNYKINLITHILTPTAVFILCIFSGSKGIAYYNILKLGIISLIFAAIVITILLFVTKEYKKVNSALIFICVLPLIICPTVVYHVDNAYDFSEDTQIACTMIDTTVTTDDDGIATFHVTFRYKDRKIKTSVSEEYFYGYCTDTEIMLACHRGAFGIDKLYPIE